MNTKNKRTNLAVSEIIGVMLMLGLSVISFSALNYYVMSAPTPNPSPIVEISGKLDENEIVIMHRGGETLSLNTELLITVGGKSEKMKVGDFLDAESKMDGVWGLGEKVVYPVVYDFDYENFPKADIMIVDQGSNSLVMTGSVGIQDPVCDLGIEITVDNQFAVMETNIVLTVTVSNNCYMNVGGVEAIFDLPEELIHYENTTTQGTYKNSTGIWDIGLLNPKQSVVLKIEATVEKGGSGETTQLVMLLDGSGSIHPKDWTLQVDGLAAAVANTETFPHDGSVELTVIQFGRNLAQIEIDPVVIHESNYVSISDNIKNITQRGGSTPTACGIYLGADTVASSSVFDTNIRQIAIIITDGKPTKKCNYDGDYRVDGDENLKEAAKSAEVARDYLISTLGMTVDQDEFNAIAVDLDPPHVSWLKEKIVWPEPSYYAPPFLVGSPHRGWLRNVTTFPEFAETIDECFRVIFNQITAEVEISACAFTDPKEANDFDVTTIFPTSYPIVFTKNAADIGETNATLNMYFNFQWIDSGEVRFAYKIESTGTWQYTPWEAQSGSSFYSKQVTGLLSGTKYHFRGQLRYDRPTSGITVVNAQVKEFTTI
jgi:Mg-chelatase subunit ChlD